MPKIIQLTQHVANLIAAGEVVERPASVVKELLENAVDAGASQVTVEIRDGGMTFLRVTDNGCGMSPEDARTAFLRHATSKLRSAEELAAIGTLGFRGEALAAIASVSRIDLLTKTPGAVAGTSLHLEAGQITEDQEAGCPEGTTILVRDLFFNTPARMKFMKSDSVEGSRVAGAVQLQALAHPEVAFRFLRDGKEVLSTPGNGDLEAAVYCVYGRDSGRMIRLHSQWEGYSLTGFVSKPSDARPSRSLQTFFVNHRPVKSKLLTAALEEAYRNQIMVGKFPACVLHLCLPANAVDVNVHPAKTEVKFLSEKAAFDCVHYGVLGALNQAPDRPQVRLSPAPAARKDFFRTMTPQEYKTFSQALEQAPQPSPQAAAATVDKLAYRENLELASPVLRPSLAPRPEPVPEPEQIQLPMPQEEPWRLVGELYQSYVLVEQGEQAYLIDKHAAHERILFDRLRAQPEAITAQSLLIPQQCTLTPEACAQVLEQQELLQELGFQVEEFGPNTVLLRQIPMDLSPEQAVQTLETVAEDLLRGRREDPRTVRDTVLHTVACKAAIKAGWKNDQQELLALVKTVMASPELKHCPHGRPICVTLTKQQLERQFKRS